MIIDKQYDASLWYMVKAGGKNRKRILKFLRELPDELVQKIRASIEELRNTPEGEERTEKRMYGSMSDRSNPNVYYNYNLIGLDDGLAISKTLDTKDGPVDLFDIILYPLDLEQVKGYDRIAEPYEEWLGTVVYELKNRKVGDLSKVGRERESEYNLLGGAGGPTSVEYNIQLFERFDFGINRPASLDNVPDDITWTKLAARRLIPRQ